MDDAVSTLRPRFGTTATQPIARNPMVVWFTKKLLQCQLTRIQSHCVQGNEICVLFFSPLVTRSGWKRKDFVGTSFSVSFGSYPDVKHSREMWRGPPSQDGAVCVEVQRLCSGWKMLIFVCQRGNHLENRTIHFAESTWPHRMGVNLRIVVININSAQEPLLRQVRAQGSKRWSLTRVSGWWVRHHLPQPQFYLSQAVTWNVGTWASLYPTQSGHLGGGRRAERETESSIFLLIIRHINHHVTVTRIRDSQRMLKDAQHSWWSWYWHARGSMIHFWTRREAVNLHGILPGQIPTLRTFWPFLSKICKSVSRKTRWLLPVYFFLHFCHAADEDGVLSGQRCQWDLDWLIQLPCSHVQPAMHIFTSIIRNRTEHTGSICVIKWLWSTFSDYLPCQCKSKSWMHLVEINQIKPFVSF